MLVNLCFHVALTCGVFVGGINQTRYTSVCQAVSTDQLHAPCSEQSQAAIKLVKLVKFT